MKKILLLTMSFIGIETMVSQSAISPNLNNWTITPVTVTILPNDANIVTSLSTGSDFTATSTIDPNSQKSIMLQLPTLQNAGMFTYSIESDISGIVVDSYQSTDGISWSPLQMANYTNGRGDDLQKVDIPMSLSNKWIQIVFRNTSSDAKNLKELGIYQFNTTGRNQYFLAIGASLTESSGGHTSWKQTINSRLGASYQPVVFNWAFSGDNTQSIIDRIDIFLQQHPNASYVMLETGGNDVTPDRPLTYANSQENLYTNLLSNINLLVQKVINAGKVPVFSRISYRNYPEGTSWQGFDQPSVNNGLNQEYGSLPYNFDIDRIIKQKMPLFWDDTERRPFIDYYRLTLNNPEWLADGTHFYGTTAFHIRDFWTDYAYKFIYTGLRTAPVAYVEYVSGLSTKTNTAVTLAESSRTAQDLWNAHILTEQISDRTTRLAFLDRLNVLEQIIIVQNPANVTITQGGTASFSVVASGIGTLSYQWQKNNIDITGANSSSYTFVTASTDNGATFRCIISNTTGSSSSSTSATLTVNALPQVPTGLTARYFSNVYASIPAMATLTRIDPNISFSWGAGSPDPSITANAFAVRWTGKIVPPNSGAYTFYTQSDDGAKLWINNQLIIDKWVYQGLTEWSGSITLTAGTAYDFKLEYFEGNGDATSKLLWSQTTIPKQVIPQYVLYPENATPVNVGPSILQQPSNITATEGNTASFTITASGTAPLTYQWQRNNSNIAGATTNVYTFTTSLADNAANYWCIVSNSVNSITSNTATLTVNPAPLAPTIVSQPVPVSLTAGGVATFTIVVTGTAPFNYQWQKNGSNITGATTSTYTFTTALSDNNALFKCIVSNTAGSVSSSGAVLTVNVPLLAPSVTQQPANLTVKEGSIATFTVLASGTAPLSYQWQRNGTDIAGAILNTYTLTSTLADDGATFRCIIGNIVNTSISTSATLSVTSAAIINGLTARYYTGVYASIPATATLTRLDPNINFSWGTGSPATSIAANAFAARWTGKIKVDDNETYTFYTQSDDGAKLWINNQLVIDKWLYQGLTEWYGSITLQAGVYYDFKLEYFEGNGDATCKLLYSSQSTSKIVVPSTNLYPEGTGARKEDVFEVQIEQEPMEIYPNPFQTSLYLKAYTMNASEEENFVLENILGTVVYNTTLSLGLGNNEQEIPLPNLPTGTYIARFGNIKKLVYKQ